MKQTLVFVLGLCVTGNAQTQSLPAASVEIDTLVRQALEDRLPSNDIADFGLMGVAARVAIRAEMPLAKLVLGAGALPGHDRREYVLLRSGDAQTQADREKRNIYFMFVDQPSITGETATLQMGLRDDGRS